MPSKPPEPVNKYLYYCRVCGFENQNPPWGPKGKDPSRSICPCCGSEFGYDDATEAGIKSARERWFNDGCEWFVEGLKPMRWTPQKQIKNLEGSQWDFSGS